MGSLENFTRHESPICIVGGGPVGMLTAFQLSRLGVGSLLAEQNLETTKWPKMDLINCRSMEIFRMLGVGDELRRQRGAVDGSRPYDSIFYTSCGLDGEVITSWPLPSTKEWREFIVENNDGSQPAEPGQRCSQIILEAWLKEKCLSQSSIKGEFGWKYLSHSESRDGVETIFIDTQSRKHVVRSKYLVGADGGTSRVRKNAGIQMLGGPLPFAMFLVHFRSQELSENLPYGKFWHMFPPGPGFIIDQDGNGTFTAHLSLDSIDQDTSNIDPHEWVYRCFGGAGEPYRFKIDEILVTSAWRPNFSLAEHYVTSGGRVMLAGDSCHRNPPHGGYGLNSGIEDALAIAWRLSAIIKGYGGSYLISSYEAEQRAIMIQRLERCHRHVMEHQPRYQTYAEKGQLIIAKTEEGKALRKDIKDFLDASGSECLDRGIELDSRYKSAVIYQDGTEEPGFDLKRYTPSSFPGVRAPHVFLKDGKTSIVDLYGPEWTLVAFKDVSDAFNEVAEQIGMPLKTILLSDERHAHAVWGYNFVLLRSDGHVAWRGQTIPELEVVENILNVVTGQKEFSGYVAATWKTANIEGLASTDPKVAAEDFPGVGELA